MHSVASCSTSCPSIEVANDIDLVTEQFRNTFGARKADARQWHSDPFDRKENLHWLYPTLENVPAGQPDPTGDGYARLERGGQQRFMTARTGYVLPLARRVIRSARHHELQTDSSESCLKIDRYSCLTSGLRWAHGRGKVFLWQTYPAVGGWKRGTNRDQAWI